MPTLGLPLHVKCSGFFIVSKQGENIYTSIFSRLVRGNP